MAKLDKKEYRRFAGKVIKLNINFEENIIYDVSEDDQVSVITGIDQFGIAFTGDINKINYKNEFDVKGDNQKIIKYKYKNEMFIFDDRRTGSFKSRITQSGLSLNRFNFTIRCRWYDYSENAKSAAAKGFGVGVLSDLFTKKKDIDNKDKKDIDNKDKKVKLRGKTWKKMKEVNTDQNVQTTVKITKDNILNTEDYNSNNLDEILKNFHVSFDAKDFDSLLYLYKVKFYQNKKDNFFWLKKRKYLNFEPAQKITFKDVEDLIDRHFFGIPFHYSADRERLKKLKKEYYLQKRALKKLG